MSSAKQNGKDRYHIFDIATNAATVTQHETIEELRAALERYAFVLYYQPKVNMKTGR